MKTVFPLVIVLVASFVIFLETSISHKEKLLEDIENSYSSFLDDVHTLTWCSIQYEKRKLAPLPIEDIVRVFDFKKEDVYSILNHSVISKDFTEYLGKNSKSIPVLLSYNKATNSWNIYQSKVENYNSMIRKCNSKKAFWYSHGFGVKFCNEIKIPEIYVNPIDSL